MEEENFWWGRDLMMGEELELEPPPPRVQLEEAGWQIPWGPAEEPAKEGLPLPPLGPGPMEVDGTEQCQRMVLWRERPQTRRLTPCWPMLAHVLSWDDCGLARCCCGGLVSCWRACGGGWTCTAVQNRLTDL